MKIDSAVNFYSDADASDAIVIFEGSGSADGQDTKVKEIIDLEGGMTLKPELAGGDFYIKLRTPVDAWRLKLSDFTNQDTWQNTRAGVDAAIKDIRSWKKKSSVGTISLTAAQDVVAGDVGYIDATGKVVLCKADAEANCPYALVVATETIAADASGKWVMDGAVEVLSQEFNIGGLIYISIHGVSDNTLTQGAPSSAGNVVAAVGVALTATKMYFFGCTIPVVLA